MNHRAGMREADRIQHLFEQVEPLFERRIVLAQPVVQRPALDMLHHDIGRTVSGLSAIVKPRDMRVVERGKNLALAIEAFDQAGGEDARPDQLDRDLVVEIACRPLSEVDRAHPAAPDPLDHAVGADALGDRLVVVLQAAPGLAGTDHLGRRVAAPEHAQREAADRGGLGRALDEVLALARRQFERLFEQLDRREILGIACRHGQGRSIRSCSQARVATQRRLTVASL